MRYQWLALQNNKPSQTSVLVGNGVPIHKKVQPVAVLQSMNQYRASPMPNILKLI
jgi:hypothetical protein